MTVPVITLNNGQTIPHLGFGVFQITPEETEARSPIAPGKALDDPVLRRIAAAVGKTTAQVTLRWICQRGDGVFPKPTWEERMRANCALFDVALDEAQMAAIDGLDRGEGRSCHVRPIVTRPRPHSRQRVHLLP